MCLVKTYAIIGQMTKLDQIDRQILATLLENADLPNKVLADKVGLSPSACLRRVAHLKKIGAIQRIVAIVDPECMERRLAAVVTVKFERHGPQFRQNFFPRVFSYLASRILNFKNSPDAF